MDVLKKKFKSLRNTKKPKEKKKKKKDKKADKKIKASPRAKQRLVDLISFSIFLIPILGRENQWQGLRGKTGY